MKTIVRIVLILLAIVGIAFSIHLTLFHIWKILDPNYVSLCEINQQLDCNTVNMSHYSKLWNLPLGIYGAGFYLVVLILAALSFAKKESLARAPELIFGISTLAMIATVGLVYISHFKIGTWCMFCVITWIINLFIWISSYKISEGGLRSTSGRLVKELTVFYRSPLIYVSLLLFSGTVLLGGTAYRSQEKAAMDYKQARMIKGITSGQGPGAQMGSSGPVVAPPVGIQPAKNEIRRLGHEPVLGNEGSPVIINVFSDFECPFCQKAAFALKEVQSRFPDKVAIIFKNYPLDYSCNSYLRSPMHVHACDAAIAGVCAKRQGKFWDLHDKMFKNDRHLTQADLNKYAQEIGVDMSAFATCLEDRSVVLEIDQDIEEAYKLGVSGTPYIYINGHRWKGRPETDLLTKAVMSFLK
jgi:protein-disulfide isomerase/uncharacterized membrane protein